MKFKPRHFPYPVLSHFNEDFMSSKFEMSIDVATNAEIYIFRININLENEDLLKMIKEGYAFYAIHIECSKTRFRKIYKFDIPEYEFTIHSSFLDETVEICSLILSEINSDNYHNSDLHPDFDDSKFEIRKGDILALGEDKKMNAEKNFDSSDKIPSIFSIVKNHDKNSEPITFSMDENKIKIKLSEENYIRFQQLSSGSNDTKMILSSMIILPTLTAVIENLKTDDNFYEYEEHRWFKVLKRKFKEHGINLDESFHTEISSITLASMLIGDPFSGSLKTFYRLINEE